MEFAKQVKILYIVSEYSPNNWEGDDETSHYHYFLDRSKAIEWIENIAKAVKISENRWESQSIFEINEEALND